MWEGSLSGGANAFVTGMYNVIWFVYLALLSAHILTTRIIKVVCGIL